MKKFYAVKVGRKPGIYDSRQACQKEVTGFPKSIFKSFTTRKEAENFLKDQDHEVDLNLDETSAIAYVDGSFNVKTGLYGSGLVFITKKGQETSYRAFDDDFVKHRNVAGEVKASEMAIQKALDLGLKKLTIFHDYQGIASRAKGERKANNDLTKSYKDFCSKAFKNLKVSFVKVKAHSNDAKNDLADKLAKEAVGLVDE